MHGFLISPVVELVLLFPLLFPGYGIHGRECPEEVDRSRSGLIRACELLLAAYGVVSKDAYLYSALLYEGGLSGLCFVHAAAGVSYSVLLAPGYGVLHSCFLKIVEVVSG